MTGHILQYRRQGWPYCSILKPQGVEIKSELKEVAFIAGKSENQAAKKIFIQFFIDNLIANISIKMA